MRRTPVVVSNSLPLVALSFGSTSGCGGSGGNSRFADGGSSSGSNGSSGSSSGLFGDDGGGSSGGSSGGGVPVTCPAGADCNVDCGGGANTTSISGFVYGIPRSPTASTTSSSTSRASVRPRAPASGGRAGRGQLRLRRVFPRAARSPARSPRWTARSTYPTCPWGRRCRWSSRSASGVVSSPSTPWPRSA